MTTRPAFDAALQLLRRLWAEDGREANALRARHLQAVLATSPWTLGATLLNVLLCVLVLRAHIGGLGFDLWALTLAIWTLMGLIGWWRSRRRSSGAVPPRVVHRATVNAAAMALTWGLLPALWWPELPAAQQLFVALLVVGNLSAGAIALAMLPSASWAFAGLQTLCAMVALQRSEHELRLPIQLLLLFFAGVLMLASYLAARLLFQRHQSEREASRQGEVVGLLLRDFEESSADVLWELDVHGRFLHPSQRLGELLQRPPEKLLQLGLLSVLAALQSPGSGGVERLRQALSRGEAFRDEVVRVRRAGTEGGAERTRWWSVTAKPLFDPDGRAQGWRGVISDVTAQRKTHQHLSYLAHFDSLTAWPTASACATGWARSSKAPSDPAAGAALCCAWIWTTSRASTTRWATASAMPCCRRWATACAS